MVQVCPRRIEIQPHPRQARANAGNARRERLVEMLEFGAAGVSHCGCKGCFRNPDGNGAASNLKPWKHEFHHDFESFALVCESRALVNVAIANQHRAAGIPTKADSVPRSTPLNA